MKDRYHLIYIVDERGRIRAVLPECRLVEEMLSGRPTNRAVSELIVVQ